MFFCLQCHAFGIWNAHQGRCEYDVILYRTRIIVSSFKFKHTPIQTNTLPVRPRPTRRRVIHSTKNINARTARRRCHFSIFGQHIRVRFIATSYCRQWTQTTASNSNTREFPARPRPTRYDAIHSTNMYKRTGVIDIVVYFYSTSGWDYDIILHNRTQITPSKSSTHQYKRTCSFGGQHDTVS